MCLQVRLAGDAGAVDQSVELAALVDCFFPYGPVGIRVGYVQSVGGCPAASRDDPVTGFLRTGAIAIHADYGCAAAGHETGRRLADTTRCANNRNGV